VKRVYVPTTLAMWQRLVADGSMFPVSGTAFAVTPALRESYVEEHNAQSTYSSKACSVPDGKALSVAPTLPRLMSLRYSGHVLRDGRKLTMEDFVPPTPETHFATPVVLLIGTSMSAGKTTTGRIIIHELKRAGFNIAGAKLTGAGRYRDVLAFRDASARRARGSPKGFAAQSLWVGRPL
jgi:hypothetical protein